MSREPSQLFSTLIGDVIFMFAKRRHDSKYIVIVYPNLRLGTDPIRPHTLMTNSAYLEVILLFVHVLESMPIWNDQRSL